MTLNLKLFRRFSTLVCKVICHAWFRIEVSGREQIPPQEGFIVIANHRSYFDPVLIGISTKQCLSFMAKEELFDHCAFGFLLRRLGVFPVNRESGGQEAMQHAVDLLQSGRESLLLFPEGTRAKTRTLLPFKAGVLLIARKADVPMIPCSVSIPLGNPFRGRVTIRFGKPVRYAELFPPHDSTAPTEKPRTSIKQAAALMREQVIALLPEEERAVEENAPIQTQEEC